MFFLRTLRLFSTSKTPNSLKPGRNPSRALELIKQLSESTLPTAQICEILDQISINLSSFQQNTSMLSSIKETFINKKCDFQLPGSAYLLCLLKQKHCPDTELFTDVLKALQHDILMLNRKEFARFIEGATYKPNLISDNMILDIQKFIIREIFDFNFSQLATVARSYRILHRDHLEEGKVFELFEACIKESYKKFPIDTIIECMNLINKVILRRPSDLHTIIEDDVVSRVPTFNEFTVSRVLSIYSAVPIYYHYIKIIKACEDKILQNPSVYFKPGRFLYLNIAHTFGKLKGYKNLMKIFEIYLAKLPDELMRDKANLGYYIYSILRNPPSEQYENYIIDVLFENASSILEMRKKKIIIGMACRESLNPHFWDNVQKLNVFWKKDEMLYVEEHKNLLYKYKLIVKNS